MKKHKQENCTTKLTKLGLPIRKPGFFAVHFISRYLQDPTVPIYNWVRNKVFHLKKKIFKRNCKASWYMLVCFQIADYKLCFFEISKSYFGWSGRNVVHRAAQLIEQKSEQSLDTLCPITFYYFLHSSVHNARLNDHDYHHAAIDNRRRKICPRISTNNYFRSLNLEGRM